MRTHGAGWMAALLVIGCSSSYRPAASPRIATAVEGGTLTFYKDGRKYPMGFFGGGVEDAVRGNPRAEEEARTGHELAVDGFVLALGGLAATTTGLVMFASHPDTNSEKNVAGGLFLGGLAAEIVSMVFSFNAVPHYYDAISIYNDGIRERATAFPRAAGPAPQLQVRNACAAGSDDWWFVARIDPEASGPLVPAVARQVWSVRCRADGCVGASVDLDEWQAGQPLTPANLHAMQGVRLVQSSSKGFLVEWGAYRFTVDAEHGRIAFEFDAADHRLHVKGSAACSPAGTPWPPAQGAGGRTAP